MSNGELAARLVALRDFLQSVHPGWRVATGLSAGSGGTPAELFRPPAIRVLPPALPSAGILRWSLEYWPARSALPDGKLTGAEGTMAAAGELRLAIALGMAPAAYRLAGGHVHRPIPGALHWTESIEEPFMAAPARRGGLLTDMREVAFLGGATFPAGTTVLGTPDWDGEPPPAGTPLVARDAAGPVYLGMMVADAPLTLAAPLPRGMGAGIVLSAAMAHRVATAPAGQRIEHDRTASEALPAMLDGTRRRRLLRTPSSRLAVTMPLLTRSEAAAWEKFLDTHRARPALLWGAEDGRLYEVALTRWMTGVEPGEGTASLELHGDAVAATDLDHHQEESP